MWARRMIECLHELKPKFAASEPEVIDYELIPDLDGNPEDMFVWFICKHGADKPNLQRKQGKLREALQECMRRHRFPDTAVRTLRVGSASLEEIEEVGGRFYYFR